MDINSWLLKHSLNEKQDNFIFKNFKKKKKIIIIIIIIKIII